MSATSKSSELASTAMSAFAIKNTSPITKSGISAAVGLRKTAVRSTRMSTTVATPTISSPLEYASARSTTIAASPVRPATRPVPANSGSARSRRAPTASWTRSSRESPEKATCTRCTRPFGETCSGPLTTASTPGMRASPSSSAIVATLLWSARVSSPRSSRLATKIAEDPWARGNVAAATSSAFTDS